VTFSTAGQGNCVEVAGMPYVYARTAQGGFVMAARCPHRGGPLNLAGVTAEGDRLVCPWHERRTSVNRLRKEIPAVRSGDRVTAVFTGARFAGARAQLTYRPVSCDLSA
jgi:Rieske 2Fe-2S protein